MITSRNDVLPLFKEWMKTQHEWTYFGWSGKYLNGWDGKRAAKYSNGITWGKLQEHDPSIMEVLARGVSDDALRDEIRIKIKREIRQYKDTESDVFDPARAGCLESDEHQIQEIGHLSMDDWISRNCGWMVEYTPGISHQEFRTAIFLDYAFGNYEYDIKYDPYESSVNELDFNDQQFIKYGLVPTNEYRKLLLVYPPRLYDGFRDETFFVKNIPQHLLKTFNQMMSDGQIKDLAIRLTNEQGYPGEMGLDYITEEVERGNVFDFVNLGNISVSRLYSENYQDCLWVVIDQQNITFEELCDDFETSEDMIVTQVMHLQYEGSDRDAYIIHLDHEYIFYTLEEYENRLKDPKQKGTAKPRMKSFKIDNSRIPFNYRCENRRKDTEGNELPLEHEQFLIYVLECYFKHKDLLREYFEKVI